MRRRGAADLALGLVLKAVLGRMDGRRAHVPVAPRRRARRPGPPRPDADRRPVRRGPLFAFMLGSGAVGLVLMVVFHSTITRVVGMTALFAFIVSGVFLIADPAFLGPDEDSDAADEGSHASADRGRG